ncbi:hypothetical protein [Spiroplasma poulsonii]|uniref:Uncharacterized protein n=1 Tax=Spiroplasma poulsonii TaxID=2138 RepID=A0A2P6FFU9_9MOLU|nr:hypothetical protein [Spiroplasma poulsonii]KAF0850150.1 hypothetical protein MSROBK_022630 [Spiroplasma poulsonii]PQM32328.1 hypothetical protein SMSRO_SF022360 [Spiroplasma poulsonii]PWF94983.1 hypothetical protein SMSE_04070 [Spiroplasma poulsonii]PWF97777.1 hypothetical protein SMH99_03260 [Spiroplasma poulsonii]
MNKRYLLIMKSKYGDLKTQFFYTLEEARITANVENENHWLTTIIDLEDSNIKWQGDK